MKNEDVVRAWIVGRVAATKSLTTNGKKLWSYQLCIADGDTIYDYTASGEFRSATTSQHVGLTARLSGLTPVHPDQAKGGE